MGSSEAEILERSTGVWKRRLMRVGAALAAIALIAIAYLWFSRERIAGDFIDDYLAKSGIAASYDIVQIGAKQQVIENVVVGDPAAPDLTVDRVVVDISYGLGTAQIGAARLERPRLYATYRDGALSLGALDTVLFSESDEPAALPALDLTIVDGGALLESDFGDVGVAFEGAGQIDDGFSGTLAAVAPGLRFAPCQAERLTAYGAIATEDGAPRFDGPVRLSGGACDEAKLASADVSASLSLTADFARFEGNLDLAARELSFGQNGAERAEGRATFTVGEGAMIVDHDIRVAALSSPYVGVQDLRAEGALRSARGYSQSSWNARFEGQGVDLVADANQSLAQAQDAVADTLLAPLLAKLERGLTSARRTTELRGDAIWRLDDKAQSLVIPEATVRNASGETILAVSRLALSAGESAQTQRLSGNFLTGGRDLPQINGRMDQGADGRLALRLTMDEYAAGEDRIAVPSLLVREERGGEYSLSGSVRASGALPGGAVDSLVVPITGLFAERTGLRLGIVCSNIRFSALAYSEASLAGHTMRACPADGRAMLAYDEELRLAIATDDLELTGEIGDSRAYISASSAALTYPGGFELEQIEARFGDEGNVARLTSTAFNGRIGDQAGGSFAGASATLDAVPLDIDELAGQWLYQDGVLTVSDARFELTDRIKDEARFNALEGADAKLTLNGGAISAYAELRHPRSGRALTRVAVEHDLSSAQGSAILNVDELHFGPRLTPIDLTELAKGKIVYTEGVVSGEGRIAWTGEDITSSGAFHTERLDLAAAFGPVQGLKGEVRFSDLLNLTTEPSQELTIESINPGIEVLAGTIRYSMTNGEIIDIEDARWPFMGGTLVMQPTRLRYGADVEQRYSFTVTALDAAKFVTQMELTNLSATGTFDGTVPIIFDSDGSGRIEGGALRSRPPGGNVSYIGELTYEDMGAISNYAFQSLRSLDYRRMDVDLDGDLAGEIITRFGIDGVRQGEDASQNFVTRRLAKLPIRFNVNVRSENFYELATMVRTFWDPEAVPDPINKGLISRDAVRAGPRRPGDSPDEPPPLAPEDSNAQPDAMRPDEPGVQPPESETMP